MSKNNLYIPLKVVPYIFISITAIAITAATYVITQFYKLSKVLKNKEESFLNESIRVLNECFDLENKNKRTINKSIDLIEYCLKEYGYKN